MSSNIVNPKTGESFEIDPSELDAAVAKGYVPAERYHAPVDIAPLQAQAAAPGVAAAQGEQLEPAGDKSAQVSDVDLTTDGKARVFNPKTGEEFHVDPSEMNAAVAKGYVLQSDVKLQAQQEAKDKAGVDYYQKQNEQHGLLGVDLPRPIDAAIAGFASPAQGLVDAVSNRLTNKTPDQQQEAKYQDEAKQNYLDQHQTAYWAGKIPAEIATALGTGDVAEGVSAGVKASGLAKAAVEGAVYSAQPVVEHVINGDPIGAAESLALGVLGNVGLHAVGGAVSKALAPKTLSEVESAAQGTADAASRDEQQRLAENTFLEKIGVPPARREELRPLIGQIRQAADITSKDTEKEALQKIQSLSDSGPEIGNAIKKLNTVEGKEPLIENALLKARAGIEDLVSKSVGPEAKQAVAALTDVHEQMAELIKRGDLNFDDTQGLKKFVAEQTNFGDNSFANNLRKQAYRVVRNAMTGAEDQAAIKVGGSAVSAALSKDRAAFALSSIVGDYADRAAAKQTLNHGSPVLDTLMHGAGRHGILGLLAHAIVPHATPLVIGASVGMSLWKKAAAKGSFGKAVKILEDAQNPATSAVLDAIKHTDNHITDSVKNMFSALTKREIATHSDAVNETLKDWLPGGGVGKSGAQQVKELRNAVAMVGSNPQVVGDHLASVTQPLMKEGLNNVAQAYTEHQLRLMKVIQAVLPQDQTMAKAHPFSSKVVVDDISPATEARYKRALSVASDPTALLAMIKSNTITAGDVAIAAATNPATLQKMRNAAIAEAMKDKPDLTYQHQLSLEILMGEHIDESTDQVPVLQSVYAAPQPMGSPKPSGKAKMDNKSAETLSDSYLPTSARSTKL